MLKFDNFIFDFDGTLSESYSSFVKAAMIIAEKYGVPVDKAQAYHLLKKYSTVRLFNTLPLREQRDVAYAEFMALAKELLANEVITQAEYDAISAALNK